MNIKEILAEINNAFFRFEYFMNGRINEYKYFGFNEAFTKLFNEAKKPENFTYNTCKLIGKYWQLTEQIRVDYDQREFANVEALDNEMFWEDCKEILYLNWDRFEDFIEFTTPDEIAEIERKFSITNILTTSDLPPQQAETKTKQKTPTAPARALFCNLINETEIIKKGSNETPEKYCKRICAKYNLKYTDRVRQNFNGNKSKKHYIELTELILPCIDKTIKEKIQKHLDSKNPPKQKLYV